MGGPGQPQVMRPAALRVPWGVHGQVQINKDGLILLTLHPSSLSVEEQAWENVILAKPSAKGFSCHKVYHPCFSEGLLAFGSFVCFRRRSVSHQVAACSFYFSS